MSPTHRKETYSIKNSLETENRRAEKEKSDGAKGSRGSETGMSVEMSVDMDVCSVWCWLESYECVEKKKHGKFMLQ